MTRKKKAEKLLRMLKRLTEIRNANFDCKRNYSHEFYSIASITII